LWLLGQIDGRGKHYVDAALADKQSDIRVVGIRLARLLKLDVVPHVHRCLHDPSMAVLRECAIALRHHKGDEAIWIWSKLADRHDGADRWYLEALGIGADRNWDPWFAFWHLQHKGDSWRNKRGRDLVWRSRAVLTPVLLAGLIANPATPADE